MKSGQLIEYKKRNIFFQKSCRKRVTDFLLFRKSLHEVKAGGLQLRFKIVDLPPLGTQ